MKKKLMRILLIALMVSLSMPALGCLSYAGTPTKWTETNLAFDWYINNSVVTTNFSIDSAAMLASVAKMVNEGYMKGGSRIYPDFGGMVLTLDADLDLSAYDWVPIGTKAHPFKGSITGGYNPVTKEYAKISGLRVTAGSQVDGYYGLLGNVQAPDTGIKLQNMNLVGTFEIAGTNVKAGAVAASVTGGNVLLENITANVTMEGSVTGNLSLGGIAGSVDDATVSLCTNKSVLTVEGADKADVGGIIGAVKKLQVITSGDFVSKNTANIDVTAKTACVGGIIGRLEKSATPGFNAAVFESEKNKGDGSAAFLLSLGDVSVCAKTEGCAGGFIGKSEFGFAAGKLVYLDKVAVTGDGNGYAGGIIGAQCNSAETTLSNCKFTTKLFLKNTSGQKVIDENTEELPGSVTAQMGGAAYVGGICGYADKMELIAPYVGNDTSNTKKSYISVSAKRDVTDNDSVKGAAGGIAGCLKSGSISAGAEIYHLSVTADGVKSAGGFFGEASLTSPFTADLNKSDTANAFTLKAEDTIYAGSIIGLASVKNVTVNANKVTVEARTSDGAIDCAAAGGLFGKLNAKDCAVSVSASAITLNATDFLDSEIGGFAGTLADCADASFSVDTIKVSAPDAEGSKIGGFAGNLEKCGKVTVSHNAASTQAAISVSFKGDGNAVGGLMGINHQNFDENTLLAEDAKLTVKTTRKSGNCFAGGVIGQNMADLDAIKFHNITMDVNLTDSYVGGVAGISGDYDFTGISADQCKITAGGENNAVGGLAGELGKAFADCAITDFALLIDSTDSFVGGAAGKYTATAGTPESTRVLGTIRNRNVFNTIGGLVGHNAAGSVISKFSLAEKCTIEMTKASACVVGGLVGENEGDIDVVYAVTDFAFVNPDESAVADFTLGGLVGFNDSGASIKHAYRTKDISLTLNQTAQQKSYVGGLVGTNDGSIEESYMNGNVSVTGLGNLRVGGLIGHQEMGSVSDSYTGNKTVSVTGADTYAGGFVGRYDTGTVTNCYTAMSVTAASLDNAGGFFAEFNNINRNLPTFSHSLYIQEQDVINSGLKTAACGAYTEFEQATDKLRAITPANLADQSDKAVSFKGHTANSWDFVEIWRFDEVADAFYPYPLLRKSALDAGLYDISWYTDPAAQSPYHIENDAQLLGLAALVNGDITGLEAEDFRGDTIILDKAIPIVIVDWNAIGDKAGNPFAGTFDGNGKMIYGLYDTNTGAAGLFGYTTADATIKNLILTVRAVESDNQNAAALVAENAGLVTGITVRLHTGAEISAAKNAGIIAGINTGMISDVTVSGRDVTVTGEVAGGVVGDSKTGSSVTDAVVTLTGNSLIGGETTECAGGVAGKAASIGGEITVHGNVNALGCAGGVAGYSNAVSPSTVLLRGTVYGGSYAGGLAGYIESPVSEITLSGDDAKIIGGHYIGGIAGFMILTDPLDDILMSSLSVSKLTIMAADAPGIVHAGGLYGYADRVFIDASEVKDLTLIAEGNPNILYIGGIVGDAQDSIFTNITVRNTVISADSPKSVYAGGAAGRLDVTENENKTYKLNSSDILGVYPGLAYISVENTSIVLNDLTSDGAPTHYVTDTYGFAGGLAGSMSAGSIYHCSVKNTAVSGRGYEGLTFGGAAGDLSAAYAVNNTVDCHVTGENVRVLTAGGFVGSIYDSTVRYNTVAGENTAVAAAVDVGVSSAPVIAAGGFAGKIDNRSTYLVADNKAAADLNIENNHSNAVLYAGGFVGLSGYDLMPSVIRSCSAETKITLVSEEEGTPVGSESYAGGFAGQLYKSKVESCYALADIQENACAKARSGGFAGSVADKAAVSNCYAIGTTVKSHGNVSVTGGFAGDCKGTISTVYADYTDLFADTEYLGTVVGQIHDGASLTAAYSDGLTSGTFLSGFDFVSDAAPWAYVSGMNGNHPVLTAFVSETAQPDLTYLYQHAADDMTVGNLKELGTVGALFNEPEIYSLFSDGRTTAAAINVTLSCDLTCTNTLPRSVSVPAEAVFDGAGHTIRNYKFDFQAASNTGFFRVNEGVIKNLTFDGADVKGGANAGIVAGINRGSISDVIVTNSCACASGVTGLVTGTNDTDGHLDEIYVVSDRIASESCAGLVAGDNYGSITKAVTFGSYELAPTGSTLIFGGIAGRNMTGATIANTMNAADLKVTSCAMTLGGIAGESSGTIEGCMTAAGSMIRAITGSTVSGNVGGIVGMLREGSITGCLALAQVLPTNLEGDVQPEGLNGFAVIGRRLTGMVSDCLYDTQMSRVADLKGTKVTSTDLLGNQGLSNGYYAAQTGMYPVLSWLEDTDIGKLSTVAINFGTVPESKPDTIGNMRANFTVTAADGIAINKSAGIYAKEDDQTGEMAYLLKLKEGTLTLTLGNMSRTILMNNKEGGSLPSEPSKKVPDGSTDVYVGGESYDIASFYEDKLTSTVTIDSDELTERIKRADLGSQIEIPLSSSFETVTAVFSVKNVSEAAAKKMDFVITSGETGLTIPASSVDVEAIKETFDGISAKKIPFFVTIARLSEDEKAAYAEQTGLKLTGEVIGFQVGAGEGNNVYKVEDFSGWTARVLPADKNAAITTGVEIIGGKAYHKPTNGKIIYSMSNSVYAYIDNEVQFADAKGKWYEAAVNEMASRLVISGYSDGSFRGEKSITRAEFAAIAVNALGLQADGKGTVFADVQPTDWFCGAVGKAYELGLVSGRSSGKFDPNANITRQEAMVILEKVAAIAGLTGSEASLEAYSDAETLASWAQAAAKFNVGNGIMKGSNGMLRPEDPIKRSETATSILLLLQKSGLIDVRTGK